MRRDVRLRLLYASLLITFCACGQITHDIGQIRTDNQKSDGGTASPTDDARDAAMSRDSGAGRADTTRTLRPPDSSYDGNRPDVELAGDGESPYRVQDREDSGTDSGEVLDATIGECFEERIDIEFTPKELDVYIMMDAQLFSEFWSFPLTPDETRIWTEVRQEISTFVDDPDSEGIGVGIQYYGPIEPGGDPLNMSYCEVSTYEQPKVPIAQLPDNAEQIKDSFPSNPINASPVVPALEGAIRHAKSRAPAFPGRKQTVFLITGTSGLLDFDPFCESSNRYLVETAEQGYANEPSVTTYAIGIYQSDFDGTWMTAFLGDVARQGGTSGPYLALLDRDNPELSQKLVEARDAAKLTACGFNLPQEYEAGLPDAIDPDLALIVVTTEDDETIELPNVRDHSFCNTSDAGWHFDDRANPNALVACERACEILILNSESISHVELQLNCPQ